MIIYTACLALGLIFTIISATMGHFFGGHDGGGDVGTGDEGYEWKEEQREISRDGI